MYQKDLGFFNKQGRKILRNTLGSSIEEDPRKGVKRRLHQDSFSVGFPFCITALSVLSNRKRGKR